MIFSLLSLMAVSTLSFAQSAPDYFAGDWKVLVKGTPSGDAEMIMHLERVDGKLVGEMKAEGMDATKFQQVAEKETSVTVYYNTMGYDISITLNKVDDDHVKGNLLGMFDATGERVVQ